MHAVFLDKNTFSIATPSPSTLDNMTIYDQTCQDDELIVKRCQDAEIIITNKVVLKAHVLDKLPKLKLIQITATGTNNVDIEACKARNISVYNIEGYCTHSVPEHTFMLILNAMRAGLHYHHQIVNGDWQADGRFCLNQLPILDLAGKTLGIIGAGTIGRQVAKLADAFGMTVLYAEHQGKTPRNDEYTAFETVLAQADIISLHCPLNERTHHLINQKTIAQMQQKPLIVNMARGAVVDSQAVAQALVRDEILAYATDVFEQEPPCDDEPLLQIKHPRLILSPHNAWASVNAQTRLWQKVCQQIDDFVQNNAGDSNS